MILLSGAEGASCINSSTILLGNFHYDSSKECSKVSLASKEKDVRFGEDSLPPLPLSEVVLLLLLFHFESTQGSRLNTGWR